MPAITEPNAAVLIAEHPAGEVAPDTSARASSLDALDLALRRRFGPRIIQEYERLRCRHEAEAAVRRAVDQLMLDQQTFAQQRERLRQAIRQQSERTIGQS